MTRFEWIGVVISLLGAWAIANKEPWGIPLFMAANVLFAFVAWDRKTWGILVLQFAYMVINLRALYVWSQP